MSVAKEAWFQIISARPIPVSEEMVDKAVTLVWAYLRDNIEDLDRKEGQVTLARWNDTKVTGKPVNYRIGIDFQDDDNENLVYRGGYAEHFDDETASVFLILNPNFAYWHDYLFEGDPEVDNLLQRMKSTIAHELVHIRDTVGETSTTEELGKEGYYNSPHEVRAHMKNVSMDLRNFFEKYDISPTDLREDQNLAFRAGLAQSRSWKKMEQYLTPENRKLVIQGVYTSLRDEGYFQ